VEQTKKPLQLRRLMKWRLTALAMQILSLSKLMSILPQSSKKRRKTLMKKNTIKMLDSELRITSV
jgi:hypothetical protein